MNEPWQPDWKMIVPFSITGTSIRLCVWPLTITSMPATSEASLTSCGKPRCDRTITMSARSCTRRCSIQPGSSSRPSVKRTPSLKEGGIVLSTMFDAMPITPTRTPSRSISRQGGK